MPRSRDDAVILEGQVVSIQPSKIPRVSIAVIRGDDFVVTMDVHEELRVFGEGDEVSVILSKNTPEFEEGRDFCAKGFIMSKKNLGEDRVKMLVSLWGFLASIEAPAKAGVFDVMDEIYYCVKRR